MFTAHQDVRTIRLVLTSGSYTQSEGMYQCHKFPHTILVEDTFFNARRPVNGRDVERDEFGRPV